jgi:ABC-type ATPase with predicted acetyltransferase domain
VKTFSFTKRFGTRVEPTDNVKACASMFGIGVDESIDIVLYEDLELKLGRGRVIYITGDSGAGKSCLLRDISAASAEDAGFTLISHPDLDALPAKPLVDQFDDMGLIEITELLNYVGIAEAFVYLRKPQELSDGQRYRFLLALLIWEAHRAPDGTQPVICVDEFLALLDRETARAIAYQVRRVANKYGICFCVATTHEDIRTDLQANTAITMRLNLKPEVKRTALAGV